VRQVLRGAGLSEAQTLSLLPPSVFDRFGLPDEHPLRNAYRVANPLSEEESVLRPTLMPGLLMAAQRNVARRVLPVRLFETGTVFLRTDGGVHEAGRVAWVMTGPSPEGWHAAERELDFFDGKGVLEALMEGLGVTDWSIEQSESSGIGHPGRTARVRVDGEEIGLLAELHPRTAEAMELPRRVVIAQLDLEPLTHAPGATRAPEIPRLPAVSRDIALIVPDDVAAATVGELLRTTGGALVESVSQFDVYRREPVPAGSVSLAYSLVLRAPDRTLTDADADATMSAIARAASGKGWTIRD
jgi:phenylalanyl-tRNA synthetase beta chain